MAFKDVLKRLRESSGLTQSSLAEKAGVSLGIMRDWEQGKKEPTLANAQKLAVALGVDCTAFADDPADAATGSTSTASDDNQPEPEATPAPKRGRPKKVKPEGEQPPEVKRRPGRPRKDAGEGKV